MVLRLPHILSSLAAAFKPPGAKGGLVTMAKWDCPAKTRLSDVLPNTGRFEVGVITLVVNFTFNLPTSHVFRPLTSFVLSTSRSAAVICQAQRRRYQALYSTSLYMGAYPSSLQHPRNTGSS